MNFDIRGDYTTEAETSMVSVRMNICEAQYRNRAGWNHLFVTRTWLGGENHEAGARAIAGSRMVAMISVIKMCTIYTARTWAMQDSSLRPLG